MHVRNLYIEYFLSASKPGPSNNNKTVTPSASVKADFPEEVIQRLMKNGFSRQAVIQELAAANGNADQALASLIAKSFQLPQ
jgi:hypothetical protein